MKHKITAVCGAVLLITGGIVAYQLDLGGGETVSISPNSVAATKAITTPSVGTLSRGQTSLTTESTEAADGVVPSKNLLLALRDRTEGEHDPMIVFGLDDFSDEEIAAYNDLHILPFNPVAGSECNEVESQYIPNSFDTVCTNLRKFPAHPYESIEPEELLGLAEHDATASLFIAKKTRDPEERVKYYIRAAALSDKSGPILALAELRFRSFEDLVRDENKKQVSVPRPDKLIIRLALESVAEQMQDPRAMPSLWRDRVLSQNFIEPKEALQQAGELSAAWLSEIKQIQHEAGLAGKLGGGSDA